MIMSKAEAASWGSSYDGARYPVIGAFGGEGELRGEVGGVSQIVKELMPAKTWRGLSWAFYGPRDRCLR